MSEQQTMTELFDRWERVWHGGQFDLVPSCVGDHYSRHDESGDRTVTREAYAAEIAKLQQERPGIRIVVHDHSSEGDRAWFRFAFKWTDPKTGEARSRAGMNPTGPRGASWWKRGYPCNRWARHGRIRRSRTGQARLRFNHAFDATRRPPLLGLPQFCRSTINCLMAPIALAGLRPFGQVFVQFMIVWQRYSLNESSSSSNRSPVASSRLSTIQR